MHEKVGVMAVKAVGKGDATRKWEVTKFTRNKGDVGGKKIVFVGASYLFVHKVLRDMLMVGGFNNVNLVVHDIDEVPMNRVADLLEKMARQKKSNIRVSRTTDRKEALKGADIVILSITTGGIEADTRSFEVCAKYGVPVGIGDTLGPAAFARNLRTLPVVLDLARAMERLCPKAVLLNFTNPMSCITATVSRYTNITCWGLCHSGDELFHYFSKVFGCKKSQIAMQLAGVNHQSFVIKLLVKGVDRTRDILEATSASNAKMEDNLLDTVEEDVKLQQDIFRMMGVWPSTGHLHLTEFYKHFYTERRLDHLGLRHDLKKVQPGRQRMGRKAYPEILEYWTYGPEPVGDLHLLTGEHAHELMWSVFTGDPFTRTLNVLNSGEYVRGIQKDACVEIIATVAGKKVTAKPVTLPPVVQATMLNWTTIHDLSIRAALKCDRDAARQALFLDPHVTDLYDIDGMIDDFAIALGEWLPEGWKKAGR
jgi:alpha-galactosidase